MLKMKNEEEDSMLKYVEDEKKTWSKLKCNN